MIIGFIVVSCLCSITLILGIIGINKIENVVTHAIQVLFGVAALTVLLNAVGIAANVQRVATLAHGLYFAATDWLVITLLLFTRLYTEDVREYKLAKTVVYAGALIDTISMLLNVACHHVFESQWVAVYGTEYGYVVKPHFPMYALHLVYVYSIVGLVAYELLYKVYHTSKIYRKKYYVILGCFVMVLVANIGYRFVDVNIDISSLIYIALAVAICHFSMFYVPRGLVARLLSFAINDMDHGIICFDKDGKCVYANEMPYFYFRAEKDIAKTEKNFLLWLDGRQQSEVEDCTWNEEKKFGKENRYFEMQYRQLRDDAQEYIGCVFTVQDRTEEHEKLRRERFRATHDPLTAILNREGFFEEVRSILDADAETERYIICTDIKDFKLVNELFGVEKGDEILIRAARMMERAASEGTVFGRLSADRYAMCLEKRKFQEKDFLRHIQELATMTDSDVYRIQIHVGIYLIRDVSMEISVMCDRAFMAINHIKGSYQQVFSYYDKVMGDEMRREKALINEFDRAIDDNQFQMFLQAQISAESRELVGAEALVRWSHPERGMISPGEFIPVFEKSGFIPRLDRYIWELACKQLRQWKEQGREHLHISVNISAKDFYYIDLFSTFTRLVERYDINPANLKLEITETAIMTDVSDQLALLERLREYGFQIEIDDFGSGYSSLNTLKDIAVDVLKVDMGFLSETSHSERGRTILNSVISMSRKLGLTVVTEGVETEEQVKFLADAGCDIFQGYYFARPISVPDFMAKYFGEH